MAIIKRILNRPFFITLFHWEYWSFHVVYGPLYPVWLLLCLKARSFFFFNTANITIRNGGFLLESKKEIYNLLPEQYYPRTLLFTTAIDSRQVAARVSAAGMRFPLIGKPDIGMRGMGVKKLDTEKELMAYAAGSKVDFLVQEFVAYEEEVGIFYYRMPGTSKGYISGIVGKEFLSVTGDGETTIEGLLMKDRRFILQLPELRKTMNGVLKTILPAGENQVLVPYGNHSRGAKFLDVSHLADETLRHTVDKICTRINGFYYGRIDIRYRTWEELKKGEHFSIIELNGAGSEPTHIYDPRHSIFFAWKEIVRHWNILAKISISNRKKRNIPYMSTTAGLKMLRENKAYVKLISS